VGVWRYYVLISIREELLDQIDSIADEEQRTRSELIRQALRMYFKRQRKETPVKKTQVG
jgi:CopG family transcriptional regulator / antitoxin EndoAI